MGTSWTSSSGSSFSFSTSGSQSGTTTSTSDYTSSMGVSLPMEEETGGGTAIAVGGEAFAVGEETIATGDIDLEIVDMGATTVSSGSSTFKASSQSEGADTAYASADTMVAVSPGDKTIAWNIELSSTYQSDTESQWNAGSTTGAVAIYQDEPQTGATSSGSTSDAAVSNVDESSQDTGNPGSLDVQLDDTQVLWDLDAGNIATLDVDAIAYGEDSFLSVDASILTVEDHLSTVSGLAIGGVS